MIHITLLGKIGVFFGHFPPITPGDDLEDAGGWKLNFNGPLTWRHLQDLNLFKSVFRWEDTQTLPKAEPPQQRWGRLCSSEGPSAVLLQCSIFTLDSVKKSHLSLCEHQRALYPLFQPYLWIHLRQIFISYKNIKQWFKVRHMTKAKSLWTCEGVTVKINCLQE